MNTMTMLPTTAQKREFTLAELRLERMRLQLLVTEIDVIGTGVKAGFIPPDSVPLMLAELFGTAAGQSDDR